MMINMNLIRGPRYIEALLLRLAIVKDLFLMELEQGVEVFIPTELSQDQLPSSYRYYDHILQLISEKMTEDRRDFVKLKGKIN